MSVQNNTNESVRLLCVSDRCGSDCYNSSQMGCFPSDSSPTLASNAAALFPFARIPSLGKHWRLRQLTFEDDCTLLHFRFVVQCSSKIMLSVLSRNSKQFSDPASMYYMYEIWKKGLNLPH